MGYLENLLPKYLARLGADVHVVTLGLLPYYQAKESSELYRELAGFNGFVPGSRHTMDGFTVHVVPTRKAMGYVLMDHLGGKLRSIRPQIVQTTATIGWIPLQAAILSPLLDYRLFTGNHYHASVFTLSEKKLSPWSGELWRCRLTRSLPGALISTLAEQCFAITEDCADVATRFFGVPQSKIQVCPLGTDTEIFRPISTEKDRRERDDLRRSLGFSQDAVVCIYTGRFSEDKNPLLLAKAIERLSAAGLPYRGLFLGAGEQAKAIQSSLGCCAVSFKPVKDLGSFYRACDIAAWPTQESTSMLDAAACGLPIIANHTMRAPERLDGNGLSYILNDLDDLVRALMEMRDVSKRREMGAVGALKMAQNFSWRCIAQRRLKNYEDALQAAL